ncbi:MAG: hypothetical protein AB7E51_08435 [Pseudodesulfovibrio sp.]|uniref:hypothetical protein n=1 Tax=Pseudodesulfovibrio sp. TaxID=2035812 RepID=UPI003D149F41
MLTATLGFGVSEGQKVLLTCWPTGAGELPGGGFDVDAWEEAQVHLCMVPGADPKTAWKAAHRRVREVARQMGGLEWLDICGVDGEPCPLPDRKPTDPFVGVPQLIVSDNGSAFTSCTPREA